MTETVESTTQVVNEISEMSKSINEYGASTVILAIFLVFFVIIFIYLMTSNAKRLKQKDEQIKQLIDNDNNTIKKEIAEIKNSIEDYHKITSKHVSKKNGISEFISYNNILKSACKEALTELKCNRVGVYVFHNGNLSLHGFSFYKMSCVGEWSTTLDGATRGRTHSQMPLHLFEDIIVRLSNEGEYFIKNTSNTDEINDSVYNFICNTRIKSLYMLAITDNDGDLAGFTICEFNIQTTKDKEAIHKVLQKVNDKISPMITDINQFVGEQNQ